jgi:thioesterase domain-containing protein
MEAAVLESLLLTEWARALRREDITIDDNFFDLGGQSLLAAGLHARIEALTRQSIPILTLFSKPTVREMLRVILDREWPLQPRIAVPIRAHGSEEPLFCIASPEVNTLGYAVLHRHLSPQRPVYILQTPPNVAQVRVPSRSELPALAKTYIDAMREIQPNGPYHLLGRCFGAHIAVEMAKQLRQAGEGTVFLGIVNSWSYYTVSKLYYVHRLLNRPGYYVNRLRALFELEPSERKAMLIGVARRRLQGGRRIIGRVFGAAVADPRSPDEQEAMEIGWRKKKSNDQKYAGTISVFRIRKQRYWRIPDATLGWAQEADDVYTELLPGSSAKALLREPHVRALARSVEACIARRKIDETLTDDRSTVAITTCS